MASSDLERNDSALGHLLAAVGSVADLDAESTAIRDQLVTLLVAGQESTPAALVHAVYWANWDPRVHARLLKEFEEHKDIEASAYLNAFHAEVLRISSVVPTGITRRCVSGFHANDPTVEVRLRGDDAPPLQLIGPTVTAPDSVELVYREQ
jgi:cytochrome P450